MANKPLLKNTMLMYIRMVFVLSISLFSSRVILLNLGIDDFGIYNLVGGIIVLASFIANTLRDGIQRFYSCDIGKNDLRSLNLTFSASKALHIIVSLFIILISLIGYWFIPTYLNIPSNKMIPALWVYTFSTLSMIVGLLTIPYSALIVSYEKFNFIAILGIVESTLKLIVAYAIPFFDEQLIGYSFLVFTISTIAACGYVFYVRFRFKQCTHSISFNKKRIYELSSFSGWNMFGAFSNLFISNGTNIVLGMFFTPTVCAARGIAYQVMVAIRQFTMNFQTVLNPRIIKEYAAKKNSYFFCLIFKGCRINLLLFSFISIPMAFYIDFVLKLWLGTYPEIAGVFVIYVFILAALEAISYPLTSAIRANGDIKKYQIVSSLIISLSVFFNYFILKICNDPVSVFISNIFFTFVALIVRFVIVYQKIKYPLQLLYGFIIRSIVTIVLQVVSVMVVYNMIETNFIGIIISYILNVSIIFFVGLSNTERSSLIVVLLKK